MPVTVEKKSMRLHQSGVKSLSKQDGSLKPSDRVKQTEQ